MTQRRGLGRGVEALFDSEPGEWVAPEPAGPGIRYVPITAIVPNPQQPRAKLQEDELTELAASIAEHGLLQPVVVTQAGEGYQLIAGERRWRAAQQAGLETIPAVIKEATSQEILELALVENIQRADLNPLEEAAAYRHLKHEYNLTYTEIARRVGKSRPAVENTALLLELTADVLTAILDGRISAGHGRALRALPTAERQTSALNTVLRQHLSVRQTEDLVRRLLGRQRATQRRPLPEEVAEVQELLAKRLDTKVAISHGKKGGRIVIHYYSDEELQAITDRIAGE